MKLKEKIKNKLEQKQLTNLEKLFLYFLIYSFIGWVLETAFAIYVNGYFVKRGFLLGPICPIYGCGAVILLVFLSRFKKSSLKLFFISSIILSFFEYVVSFAMDALFAMKWWDYSTDFFNLNGRISIAYAFCWGIISIIFINHLHPFIEKRLNKNILNKVSTKLQVIILYTLMCAAFIDAAASIGLNFQLNF